MGIIGHLPSLISHEVHPLLALYLMAALLSFAPFMRILPSDVAHIVYFGGFLVFLGLWWAGMIGALGSLISCEAHPLRVLSLLGFYVIEAASVILCVSWHIKNQIPLIKLLDFR